MTICTRPTEVIEAFRQALLTGNVEALAALYEEDATFYNIGPDLVTSGQPAIREAWQGFIDSTEVLDFTPGQREEKVVDDYAFAHMPFTLTSRPRGTAMDPVTIQGRTTEVIHRGYDKAWRYH